MSDMNIIVVGRVYSLFPEDCGVEVSATLKLGSLSMGK